ncbi:MAG: pirin family protein [Rhodovibrionaceae bacterium]
MIEVRPFDSLGRMKLGWLDANYHFSFANYDDPGRRGWGKLLVWNDDTIQPGTGFEMHGHRDMEIVTYVRRGAISHSDHLGNAGRTEAGDVQVMSAGKGILHAERNEEADVTQLFQIWILPNRSGVKPGWQTRSFPKGERAGELVVLASGRDSDAGKDPLPLHQDAAILAATLEPGQSVTHRTGKERHVYLVPATGRITVNGQEAAARDGLAITGEEEIVIAAEELSEILLADVPA